MKARIAWFLRVPPSEVDDLSDSDYMMLSAYWNEEPWGPYRDNLHSGIVASTIINGIASIFGKKGKSKPSDFLLVKKEEFKAQQTNKTLTTMRLLARDSKKRIKK